MRRLLYQPGSISLFSCILIIAVSCNNVKDNGKTDAPVVSDSNITKADPVKQAGAALIGGTLDTLWISATDFPANPEKIVFSFTIDQYDKLKLHGWKVKGGATQFDDLPNYKLQNAGQHNGGTYGPNIYFGNLVLKQSDVKAIRRKINQGGYTKVLFVPRPFKTYFIAYDIFVGKDNAAIKVLAVDPTGSEANPSPPKNY
jgi:hypothetical protein